jgi:hypothetical protein
LNRNGGSSLYFNKGSNSQHAAVASYNNSTGSLTMNLVLGSGSTQTAWTFLAYGIWQCTVSCNASTTPAWTQIAGWPSNNFDQPNAVTGDMNIYNRVYVAFSGAGFQKFN